jgi:hypothetical protein
MPSFLPKRLDLQFLLGMALVDEKSGFGISYSAFKSDFSGFTG